MITKVAVVTPSLMDRNPLLLECKAAVVNQDWDGEIFHSIAVDKIREGPATVCNRLVNGLDPSYEWVAFVDDDDIIFPDHISTLVAASDGADVIYSDCELYGYTKNWVTREFNIKEIMVENYIPVTVLIRRSMFEKAEGFQATRKHPADEDFNLWLKCHELGAKFVFVPKVTWLYRSLWQYSSR